MPPSHFGNLTTLLSPYPFAVIKASVKFPNTCHQIIDAPKPLCVCENLSHSPTDHSSSSSSSSLYLVDAKKCLQIKVVSKSVYLLYPFLYGGVSQVADFA